MKKYMMIVGCEIVNSDEDNPDDSIFKLKLMELVLVKKHQIKSVMKIITGGGDPEELAKTIQQVQQRFDVVYTTLGEWRDKGYKIGKHVTMELLPDDTTGGMK